MRVTYLQALAKAIYESMETDSRVILMGSRMGGHFENEENEAFEALHQNFEDRIFMNVPIAEFGLAGAGVGAAIAGGRPLLSFNIASFMLHGFPPIVNEAPNVHYTTGGRCSSPLTCYALGGLRKGGSSQHSHRLQAMVSNVPGLQVFVPATPTDAYGLLKWCLLESKNPTVVFAHSELLLQEEDFDSEAQMLPIGSARICKEGKDITIVASSVMVKRALEAAEVLASKHDVHPEVIDMRTLCPIDHQTLIDSIAKTGKAVILDECHRSFGVNAELSAVIAEKAFWHLKAPIIRVATADTPVPYNLNLEHEMSANQNKIIDGVLSVLESSREKFEHG